MRWPDLVTLAAIIGTLAIAAPRLGRYMATVYDMATPTPGDRVFVPIERVVYRLLGVNPRQEQRWSAYAASLLAFSLVGMLGLYALLRLQGWLPFNPTDRDAVSPTGAFNASISFVTNTNWQWFAGESSISHLSQMIGFTVQNFVSAAAGLCVAVALIRGIARAGSPTLGNFWVDLVRGTLRILVPLSFVVALVLASQGVVQNLSGTTTVAPIDSSVTAEVVVPGGPVASQEAIKEIGTNGGGFFNANSTHPFENPNGFTNTLQIVLLLLIPFALVVAFGRMVRDPRQSRVLASVMAGVLALFTLVAVFAEQEGNPRLTAIGVDQSSSTLQSGGNLEGKEVRFGATGCGMYAAATTGTSTGSVNCMHDSATPLGGLVPMLHIMLGEISPGGVGVGLSGALILALLAVFIAGLMVGRTPEYLGKKIQANEMKLVTLYILAMPFALLPFAAASVVLASANTFQPGAHGLSEVLYNYASTANNNGSAFAYQGTGTDWYTITQGISMLMGRFLTIIPVLAIGGSLAAKPRVPETSGTLPTHSPLFGGLLAGVIAIVAGLTFFPALALGPILEHLSL